MNRLLAVFFSLSLPISSALAQNSSPNNAAAGPAQLPPALADPPALANPPSAPAQSGVPAPAPANPGADIQGGRINPPMNSESTMRAARELALRLSDNIRRLNEAGFTDQAAQFTNALHRHYTMAPRKEITSADLKALDHLDYAAENAAAKAEWIKKRGKDRNALDVSESIQRAESPSRMRWGSIATWAFGGVLIGSLIGFAFGGVGAGVGALAGGLIGGLVGAVVGNRMDAALIKAEHNPDPSAAATGPADQASLPR